ncbi:hypothetical protein M0Q50_00845 [bacterium]|jgi:hypothetical protein|nr:hypothetical protein [bacterium]
MNVAEKTENFLGSIDINPKLPIFVGELPEPTMNIYLQIEENTPKAYWINHFLENREVSLFPEISAVYHCSYVTRLRAQIQYPEMELFPEVSVEQIGGLKEYMLMVLERSNQNNDFTANEIIDCRVFSESSCILYEKSKESSFPIIRNLASKNARHTAQTLTKLNIKIKV